MANATEIKIEDGNFSDFKVLIEGRRIISIVRAKNAPPNSWEHGENHVTITLDDGAELFFTGWGHDASGLDTYYKKMIILKPRKGESQSSFVARFINEHLSDSSSQ